MTEQLGVPIPSLPVLLAIGALIAQGKFSFLAALSLCVLACLLGDSLWYGLGRARGHSILKLLCRVSLEPDSCVNGAKSMFGRWGLWALVFAKFVPGLGTVAPTMAGLTGRPPWRLLAADIAGAALWASAYIGAGLVFSTELGRGADRARRMGGWLGALLAGLLAAYLGWKYYQRRKSIRDLRVARITPEELFRTIETGGAVTVLDLRHPIELETAPETIPGAIRFDSSQLDGTVFDFPADRDVILYCT